MQNGFAIEFSVDVAQDGNDAQIERFRVLVKDETDPAPAQPPSEEPPRLRSALQRIATLEGELRVRDDELAAARDRIEAYDEQFLAQGVLEASLRAVACGIGLSDLNTGPEEMADSCLKVISNERDRRGREQRDLSSCVSVIDEIVRTLDVTVPMCSPSEWCQNARTAIVSAIRGLQQEPRSAWKDAKEATQEPIRVRLEKIVGTDTSIDGALHALDHLSRVVRDEARAWPMRFGTQSSLVNIVENFISDYRVMTSRHDFLDRTNAEIRKLVGADSEPMTDTVMAVRDALKQGRDAAAVVAALNRLVELQEPVFALQQEYLTLFKRVHGEG